MSLLEDYNSKHNYQKSEPILSYLRPTASMGSSSSLISGWMLGPIALESMLIQVNTVASTCIVFCLLHIKDKRVKEKCGWMVNIFLSRFTTKYYNPKSVRVQTTFRSPLIKQTPMHLLIKLNFSKFFHAEFTQIQHRMHECF